MLLVQRERVLAARRADRPQCAPMGREERVAHDAYAEQEPGDVARQLVDAAALFGNVLARLGADDWTGRSSTTTQSRASDRCGGSPCTPRTRRSTTCSTFVANSVRTRDRPGCRLNRITLVY
jgi:hypothetical protein